MHLAVGRTLVLDGTHVFATEAVLDAGTVDAPVLRLSSVIVQGNVLRARGAMPAVHMITGLDIKFSDNRCTLNGGEHGRAAELQGGRGELEHRARPRQAFGRGAR